MPEKKTPAYALQEYGWSLSPHGLAPEILAVLVAKKNEYLQASIHEVQSAFGVSFDRFDSDKVEYIELSKAITRGFLRYDANSFRLARAIFQKLKKEYELAGALEYVTLPYPIIHFSYDTSETGPKHKDGYDYIEHFYTTWTPLNDCFHKPISVTEKTHRKNGFLLRQIRSRLKFIDRKILASKKIIYPDLPLGEFLLWHGTTDHEGLLNSTNDITTSLVCRFTSSPILYDVTLSCDGLEKAELSEDPIDTVYFTKKLVNFFREIDELSGKNAASPLPYSGLLEKAKRLVSDAGFSAAEWKRAGFALGLWAQRLEAKRDVFLFYLVAFLGAHDNFYVFHRCITSIFKLFGKQEAKQFIQESVEKYPSRQLNYVIKSALTLAGESPDVFGIRLPEEPPFLNYDFG